MRQVSGYFLILFMIFSFVVALPAAVQGYRTTEKFTPDMAVNGGWASQYEKEFADVITLRKPGLTLWGMAELALFRGGRPGVLIGRDGWLFSDEEFTYAQNREALITRHKAMIGQVIDRLHHDGVAVAVALLPAKSRIAESKLGRFRYPSYNRALYGDILAMLRTRDVFAPDLNAALRNDPESFLRTDTHWSPQGARIAADAVATAIRQKGKIGLETQGFILEEQAPESLKGDLLRYVPAGPLLERFSFGRVEVPQHAAITSAADDGGESALFGDVSLPVTLVGTSYSANGSWNFADYLKVALQSDLFNAADEGRGPFATMRDYLDSAAYKTNPPQLVIWEIPERYMALPEAE
ncbi:MAG: alginate O-acetyltransferase [Alphaproteobacteria bacterium]